MKRSIQIITGIALIACIVTFLSVVIAMAIVAKRGTEAKKSSGITTTGANPGFNDLISEGNTLTAAEVETHNTATNCWMIIDGSVYDVTSFLSQHPGGSAVMVHYCGKDASNAFDTKAKKPAVAHSRTAIAMLADYFVGKIGEKAVLTNQTKPQSQTRTTSNSGLNGQVKENTNADLASAQSSGTVLTASEVATHNTSSNCWLIISGQVYNVTNYLTSHPGGVGVITPYCGKDASNAFSTKGGQGGNHSSYAYSLLNNYLIGSLGATVASSNIQAGSGTTQTAQAPTVAPSPTNPPANNQTGGQTLTSAEAASHNTTSNCWLIISNNVYNVTNYLVSHPGGVSVIAAYCGKEATNAFSTKGGRGSNHSSNAYSLLNNYLVGALGSTAANPPTSGGGGSTGSTPAPQTGSSLPASVSAKYPGATVIEQSSEDDGRIEMKINYNGSCRKIKLNSSSQITSDERC